ncbi:MAG: hypothetical protein GY812_10710 [Actinomycetia bacterium]|nr:hypothetical protein [Actinomycetes bacterium]
MGLVARNPEQSTVQQGGGELLGSAPTYATGTVHIESVGDDGEVVRHSQRFEEGRLAEWSLDDAPAPWALVRPGAPTDPCATTWASRGEVEAVKVRVGDPVLELPPRDDLPHPGFHELVRVPDATARLRFAVTGSPVGRIVCDIRYQDGLRPLGRVVDEWPEDTDPAEPAHEAPLIDVEVSFANYLRMRTGEKTSLEAIADGGGVVDTRWTLLLLLHGIVQEQRYVDIYRSLPVLPAELGWWGEAAPFVASDATPR